MNNLECLSIDLTLLVVRRPGIYWHDFQTRISGNIGQELMYPLVLDNIV
jgi:hypothetical protein